MNIPRIRYLSFRTAIRLTAIGALLAVPHSVGALVWAQTDSVVVVSPRVGRIIDFNERTYFDVFRDCPDSDVVFLVGDTAESGGFIVRSSNPDRHLKNIDTAALTYLRAWIECREARNEGIPREESAEMRDEGEGNHVSVELSPSGRRSGEMLFADLHGIVLHDTATTCILASEIRSITTPRVFGEGIRTMAQVGVATGIAIFGLGGALGGDTEAGSAVFATAFFSGVGVAVGFLYDLFASAAGDVSIVSVGQKWNEDVILDLQMQSRFPLGTPDLKRMLGEAREQSLRQQ